jgi:hypothetical protein
MFIDDEPKIFNLRDEEVTLLGVGIEIVLAQQL